MTLSSLNITGFKIAAEKKKKMNHLNITGYKNLPNGIIPEQELISVREEIRLLERSVTMNGEAKSEEKPIRKLLNYLEKDLEYSLELQKTLRDNLAPVLNSQPKIEKTGGVEESVNGSSTVFNDLDALSRKLKRLNTGLIELLEDLEI